MLRRFVLFSLFALTLSIASTTQAAIDADLFAITAETGSQRSDLNELREEWGAIQREGGPTEVYLTHLRTLAFGADSDEEVVRHYIQAAGGTSERLALRDEMEAYVEKNSSLAAAHYYLGMTDPTAGAPHFSRSLEIDPHYYYGQVAMASHEMTQSGSALASAKGRLLKAAAAHPDRSLAFVVLDQFYRKTGDLESSRHAVELAAKADPWDSRIRGTLMSMMQAEGSQAQENGTLQEWAATSGALLIDLAQSGNDPSLAFVAARISSGINDRTTLLKHLETAAELGFADYHSLSMDRSIAKVIGAGTQVDEIRAKMKANRAEQGDRIKEELRHELISEPAPAADFALMGGGQVDLGMLRGKMVVLDFWATWCGPCRRALPALQSFYDDKPTDVDVYCVNVFERDGGKSIESFWKKGGYPMPVALGTQSDAGNFGVSSIPSLFVIGPGGNVRYRHTGFSPYLAETLGLIAQILREEAN